MIRIMNIYKKNDCFELYPKTELDCQFIDYIEGANEILVGSKLKKTEIGKCYNIRAFKIVDSNRAGTRMTNKMKDGEIQ